MLRASPIRGGARSDHSSGNTGTQFTLLQPGDCPIRVGARSDYSSGKTGSLTLRQPGRPNKCGCQVLIPEGWRERISTSLPANAQSDQPRDHSAKTLKTKIIMVDFHQTWDLETARDMVLGIRSERRSRA